MTFAPPLWLVALVAAAVGAAGAASYVGSHYRAEIADIRATQAREEAAAERLAREKLAEATTRGNALSADLLRSEASIHQLQQEVSRAARSHTTGRECLSAGAVRVFNQPAAPAADAVPAAAGRADAAGAAAAADPHIDSAAPDGPRASDSDIAGWIADARAAYALCRGRLDQLITFEEARQ